MADLLGDLLLNPLDFPFLERSSYIFGHILGFFKAVIGYGNFVSFWHESWCFNVSLKEKYHTLFELVINKNNNV